MKAEASLPVPERQSYVVRLFGEIFEFFLEITPLELLRKAFGPAWDNDGRTDDWVLVNTAAAFFALTLSTAPDIAWWEAAFLVWGAVRVFETTVNLANYVLFGDYRARKRSSEHVHGAHDRLVVLALLNYVECVFWYALAYRNFEFLFLSRGPFPLETLLGSLSASFLTMSIMGSPDFSPNSPWGMLIFLSQVALGLFLILMILSRFISFLTVPKGSAARK